MDKPAPAPKPEGMPSLMAHLWFKGNCRSAIELYRDVFDARLEGPMVDAPDGKAVLHAVLRIGDSPLMLADAPPRGWEGAPEAGTSTTLWLYVADCDAVFERAVAAGCEVMMPLADAFWGDRFGKVKDRFGHVWAIATWKWELDPEEIARRKAKWLRSL